MSQSVILTANDSDFITTMSSARFECCEGIFYPMWKSDVWPPSTELQGEY